jgi:predicted O-methyltransferase YrrM
VLPIGIVFLSYQCFPGKKQQMMIKKQFYIPIAVACLFFCGMVHCVGQTGIGDLNANVEAFLAKNKQQWRDLNVPFEDGKVIHDLILAKNYKSALEIGTSTGHSTIWIAWALSKTGGKLITIEINANRQQEAIKNLKALGLDKFVDFRLGNGHQLIKELDVPLDFVFSDADKDWYIQYFKDVHPNLLQGGSFTAHNVLQNQSGIAEYMEFVKNHPDYTTTVDRTSSAGIAISLKK